MIDGKIFFDYSIKNDLIASKNIWNIATGQGDNYTTGCLLDYNDFKNYYKMRSIDLSKQQALNPDPRAILQNGFTANPDRTGQTTMFFIIEEAKEIILDFWQGTLSAL